MIEKVQVSQYACLEKQFADYFDSLTLSKENPFLQVYIYKNKEIIGFIAYSEIYERCELEYIAVINEEQGKRVASQLLDFMIKETEKEISLEVSKKNQKAIHLYERKGFQIIGDRPHYYHNEDAYIMVLSR